MVVSWASASNDGGEVATLVEKSIAVVALVRDPRFDYNSEEIPASVGVESLIRDTRWDLRRTSSSR